MIMDYEGSPKHKMPWKGGAQGSLCPRDVDEARAKLLLALSETAPEKPRARFAVHEGRAFCARPHTERAWHGFPVGWREVPVSLRRKWKAEGRVSRRDLKRYW